MAERQKIYMYIAMKTRGEIFRDSTEGFETVW